MLFILCDLCDLLWQFIFGCGVSRTGFLPFFCGIDFVNWGCHAFSLKSDG